MYNHNFLFLALLIFCSSCFQSNSTTELPAEELQLGKIDFQVTGNEEAQTYFKNGVLLLHSFEYDDARDEFLKAQEYDSTFAMAYWGEAMTHNHTIWQRQEKEKALTALEKLAENPGEREELAVTELEKDFFRAIEILYGEGTKYDRDLAYSEFMQGLTEKYPDNNEVAAFYAIALLGSSRNGRNAELYDHSARIAQGIIKENSSHPGALHYLIHSYDDPEHATLASNAADSYAKVAPDATHALHMPSHIYVAMGSWDKVINSNIASWNASVKRINLKGLTNSAGSYHALNWLQYGFLQRGETEQATQLLKNMVKFAADNPDRQARSYLLSMKGGHMVETNTWEGDMANIEIKTDDLNIVSRVGNEFLEGMKAYHEKNSTKLDQIIEGINVMRTQAELTVGDAGFAMCGAGGYTSNAPDQLDIDMARVMELELLAYRNDLKGDFDEAGNYFEKAIELDERLSYSFGPPDIFKPAHEAYGEWLLLHQQADKALHVFNKSLKRNPRRLLSLKGLKSAAEQVQNRKLLAEVKMELEESLAEKKRGQIL